MFISGSVMIWLLRSGSAGRSSRWKREVDGLVLAVVLEIALQSQARVGPCTVAGLPVEVVPGWIDVVGVGRLIGGADRAVDNRQRVLAAGAVVDDRQGVRRHAPTVPG